ncbi:MAG TPA: DUF5916 domain-containing protein [Vicinamibacteria bacterium]|nr:DUF5916 domain-containing protein [Vicinamibacteria bacterium]
MSRDNGGRVTLRSTRLIEPIVLDGQLTESVYEEVSSISGFIQQEPREGEPATEQTEVWVFHDDANIYVAARCWDSHPERMVANEMRRDNNSIDNNENFAVIFDTFYDRRNGFLFHTNPLGAIFDGQVTDESNLNSDWNTVWHVKTGHWPQGWTVEFAIPFKSLRYQGSDAEIWGINFRRIVMWKNEWSYLTRVGAAYGWQGIQKLSTAATLVGHQPPSQALNLELKPFATGGVRTDLAADQPYSNDLDGDVGFDLKYGLTRGLTADFTLNTDFAQVEADEQQVNLTRFGLFFPEKRDFFLEGKDVFGFAGVSAGRGGGNTPVMFFSRQIGLADDFVVPINAGGRVTGRAGAYTLGALAIQTDGLPEQAIPTTNYGAFRLKRDVLRRSNIGIISTYRSPAVESDGSNKLLGLDGNFSFYQNVDINAYYARTDTPDRSGKDASYRGRFQYGGDRYGVELERLVVEENFNPEIGFTRREDFEQSFGKVRFSPRPRSIEAVRKFTFETGADYITNGAGRLESRQVDFQFQTEFQSGDQIFASYQRNYEFLDEEFDITDDVIIPIGGYSFERFAGTYRFGTQRKVSGQLRAETGSFYSGDMTELLAEGRVEITPQFSIEPRVSVNWVDLVEGSFTTKLFLARLNYMISPRTFLGTLLQYNSEANEMTANIRFRWEYQPGSDIFVVYSDGRDTLASGFPALQDRSLVVKFTRLFRF